jgi:predicted HTH transcriptional regulator
MMKTRNAHHLKGLCPSKKNHPKKVNITTPQMLAQANKQNRSLCRTAHEALKLFESKEAWGPSEVAAALSINKNTAAKTVKTLVDGGYIVKHGTTKGAWYTKMNADAGGGRGFKPKS